MVAYTREFSATDHDAYAKTISPQHEQTVYASLGAQLDITSVAVTHAWERWIVAVSVQQAGIDSLTAYFHDFNDFALNSGVTRFKSSTGRHLRNVDLGGTESGNQAMLVFEDAAVGSSSVRSGQGPTRLRHWS